MSTTRTTPSPRVRLRREGFVHLRNVVPPALLEAMRADLYASAARQVARKPGRDATVFRSAEDPQTIEARCCARSFLEPLTRLASFKALMRHGLTEIVPTVASGPFAIKRELRAKWIRVGVPRCEPYMPAHQDIMYLRRDEAFYTVWIPLHDCPVELGGVRVVPGSHRHGPLYHAGFDGIPVRGFGLKWRSFSFALGDALVFHRHLIHASSRNRTTDRLRFSVDFRIASRA